MVRNFFHQRYTTDAIPHIPSIPVVAPLLKGSEGRGRAPPLPLLSCLAPVSLSLGLRWRWGPVNCERGTLIRTLHLFSNMPNIVTVTKLHEQVYVLLSCWA